MSWSVHYAGKPEEIVTALQAHSTTLDGQSKDEYDTVLPHLVGIAKQNFGDSKRQIEVSAYGHGYEASQAEGSPQSYRECTVTVRMHDPLV